MFPAVSCTDIACMRSEAQLVCVIINIFAVEIPFDFDRLIMITISAVLLTLMVRHEEGCLACRAS